MNQDKPQFKNVRVLPNERNNSASDRVQGFGMFDKPLTKASGTMETRTTDSASAKAPKETYKATVFMGTPGTKGTIGNPTFGARGVGSASGLTKQEARRKAYNAASDAKMKSTQEVSKGIAYEDSFPKKASKTVKINSNPVKDSD